MIERVRERGTKTTTGQGVWTQEKAVEEGMGGGGGARRIAERNPRRALLYFVRTTDWVQSAWRSAREAVVLDLGRTRGP